MQYLLDFERFRIVLHILRCFMHLSVPFMLYPSQIWPFRSIDSHSEVADVFVFLVHVGIMEAFFILNGFFAIQMLRKKSVSEFIYNRFRRIVVPCLVGLIILIPYVMLLSLSAQNKTPIADSAPLLIQYLKTHSLNFGHLWSLWYLILIYLLFLIVEVKTSFLTRFLKRLNFYQVCTLLISFAVIVLLLFYRKYTLLPVNRLIDWQMLLYYFFFFCLGVWCYEYRDKIQKIKPKGVFYLIVIAAIIVNVIFQKTENPHPVFRFFGLLAYSIHALGIVLILYTAVCKIKLGTREKVKNLSHSMYWLYWIEVPIAITLHYFFLNKVHPLIVIFIGVILTLTFSVVSFNLLIKNTKFGKLLGFSS